MDGNDSSRFSSSSSLIITDPRRSTAAAIALGQASALTIMVCDLTIGKEKWKDGWGIAEKALLSAVKIMSRAGELADEDSDAFDEVMACFRVAKG